MQRIVNRFWADEAGASAIEYGLIGALIAIVVVFGATRIGSNLNARFMLIANALN